MHAHTLHIHRHIDDISFRRTVNCVCLMGIDGLLIIGFVECVWRSHFNYMLQQFGVFSLSLLLVLSLSRSLSSDDAPPLPSLFHLLAVPVTTLSC